jgi:hypothetical protein
VFIDCLLQVERVADYAASALGLLPVPSGDSREEQREQLLECACRGVMLRQDELAFLKAISSFQVSPAMVKELRLALA